MMGFARLLIPQGTALTYRFAAKKFCKRLCVKGFLVVRRTNVH